MMKRITPEQGMARWIWASVFCAGVIFFAPLVLLEASYAFYNAGASALGGMAYDLAVSFGGWEGHEYLYALAGGFAILVVGDIRAWLKHRKLHRVAMQVKRTARQHA